MAEVIDEADIGLDKLSQGAVPQYRLFAVIAKDATEGWRVKDVKAFDHDHAADIYNVTFPLNTVLGVALLGGSGHPVHWLDADEYRGADHE